MTWVLGIGLTACLLAAAVATLSLLGARRWRKATRALLRQLESGRVPIAARPAAPGAYDPHELDGLPAPVQRYFRAALTPGQALITAATVEHAGRFNLSATGERWVPFTSQQRVVTHRPGFLWNAAMPILPGLSVRVHDGYIGGEGLLRASLMGLVTLADVRGSGDLAGGELMRYGAEAAWYPTALLPSQGVQWTAVDDHSANATWVDGAIRLTLLFRFNAAGLIDSMRAEARGRSVGKVTVMAPWEGNWSDYRTQDGMAVPFTGEVAWMLPEGRKPYWRGSITRLAYETGP